MPHTTSTHRPLHSLLHQIFIFIFFLFFFTIIFIFIFCRNAGRELGDGMFGPRVVA